MLALILLFVLGNTSAQLAGGWTEQNANDKDYMNWAWKTATKAVNNDASNAYSNMALVPVKVISAKTQVVAGQNIELVIQFGNSNCRKDANEITASACKVSANSPTKTYKVRIFNQPWTNTVEVTNIEEIKKP